MKEINFKTLMYMGHYVDTNLLGDGIYWSAKPYIYSMDETIESLIQKAETFKVEMRADYISEDYFENLKQCQLVPVVIRTKEEDQDKALLIANIREVFADYVVSEGCSCCQNTVPHEEANLRLAELLGVALYEDGSGVNWAKYKSKPIED